MLLTIHQFISYTSITLISQFSVKNKKNNDSPLLPEKTLPSSHLEWNGRSERPDVAKSLEVGDVKNQGCLLQEVCASSPWTQKTSEVADGRERWWQKWRQ